MFKFIAPGIPIAQQGIPFAGASAKIWEAHRAQKSLPMPLPISSTLPNPQKQRTLPRHKKMHTAARVSVTNKPPPTQKIYTLAGRWNIVQVNSSCNPAASCLLGESTLQAAHPPKSQRRLSTRCAWMDKPEAIHGGILPPTLSPPK